MAYDDRLHSVKAWIARFEFEGFKFKVTEQRDSFAVKVNIKGVFDGRDLKRIADLLLKIQKEIIAHDAREVKAGRRG